MLGDCLLKIINCPRRLQTNQT